MPVRGIKQVRQFRGVVASQIRKANSGLESLLFRDTQLAFLTADQRTKLNEASQVLTLMYLQKVLI